MLAGCAALEQLSQPRPQTEYAANIPAGQTVTVLAFNDYSDQIKAARDIEMLLVQFGFNVVSHQANSKTVERRSGAGASGASAQSDGVAANSIDAVQTEVTIERYVAMDEIRADYLFKVMRAGYETTAQVTRTRDHTVLAICRFSGDPTDYELAECLIPRGLAVERLVDATP